MSLTGLIPELQPYAQELINECGRAGLQPRVTSTLRSFSAQTRLYTKYLAGQSRYPAAPPGTSAHEFGWAFDMVVQPIEYLNRVGSLWESWGGVWGGRFHDPVHFEYPGFQAPEVSYSDALLRTFYRAANLASYVVTPLAVEESRAPGVASIAERIDALFGSRPGTGTSQF